MIEKCMTCLMIKIQTTKLVNQNAGHLVPGLFFSFLTSFSFIEHFSNIDRIQFDRETIVPWIIGIEWMQSQQTLWLCLGMLT